MTTLKTYAQLCFKGLREIKHKRLALILLSIYLSGYVYVRTQHMLVHAMGYGVTDQGRVVLQHRVKRGDFGVPIFNLVLDLAVQITYLVYLPVLPFETIAWNIIHPPSTVLPHTERSLMDLEEQKRWKATPFPL